VDPEHPNAQPPDRDDPRNDEEDELQDVDAEVDSYVLVSQ
jgi:hypothetical protein